MSLLIFFLFVEARGNPPPSGNNNTPPPTPLSWKPPKKNQYIVEYIIEINIYSRDMSIPSIKIHDDEEGCVTADR